MTQQLVLEPLGIITEPNKLGHIPAGGLASTATCAIRSPGILETARAWASNGAINSDAGTTAGFLVTPPGPLMLAIFNRTAGWFYSWINQTTGNTIYGPTALSFTLGGNAYPQSIPVNVQPGFSYVIHGKQLLVNMFSTVIVWDTYEPTTVAEATPRPAGLFPPQLREVFTPTTPGTALAAGTYATYVAIYKRQVGDTLLVSAPSPALSTRVDVPSGGHNIPLVVWMSEVVKAGDILEIYRTKSKPTNGTGVYYTYQKAEEVGAEYQKATSVVLTSADVAGTIVTVTDTTSDANLGEALYTNQAVGSLGASAFPPPALRFMTSHKGYVFGFGTTAPPSITLRPTGTWAGRFGDPQQAQAGFGEVSITGCTWSAGGPPTVVTVSPTSQLAYVKVGTQCNLAGGAGVGSVTAVGASTFTINGAASAPGAASSCIVRDIAEFTFGLGTSFFSTAWANFPAEISTRKEYMLIAPALKLPSVTPPVGLATQPVDGFTVRAKLLTDARTTFGARSSGEKNWDPDISNQLSGSFTQSTIESKPRAMVWSDQNQPESWPFVNADTFARGQPCAFASTRDCIVAFYTDAIWRISGTGGTARDGFDWRADPIVTGVTIQGSQAVCVLHDVVYAMTSEGFISFDGSNLQNISKGRIHDQLECPPWTDGPYTTSTACCLIADEERNEIIIREPSLAEGAAWVYNVATDTFVKNAFFSGVTTVFHGDYSRTLRAPVVLTRRSTDNAWFIYTYGIVTSGLTVDYQPVYADNPFAQRQWQSIDVVAEATSPDQPAFNVTCNGVAASLTARPLVNGRVSFEVPRNAPAIGNTMAIRVTVSQTAGHVRILGVCLNYRDATDRRRKR